MFFRLGNRLKMDTPNILCLLALILISGCITYYCFRVHVGIGPIWDTYDLMANAAFYAGRDIGYYDFLRPPGMSILTSFCFNGGLCVWPIMLIDGLIFVLGSVGLYIFFKLRFDELTSFLGALLFTTFPIVLTFATEGLTDLPSVCISIWGLLFTVLAVKKDHKFFYLAFPILMMAFLTRFSSALMFFPVFLYILINKDEIKTKKEVLIGILLSILLVIPFFLFSLVTWGNPLYILFDFFRTSSVSVQHASTMTLSFNTDLLYYVKLIHDSIQPMGIFISLVVILGFFTFLLNNVKGNKWFESLKTSLKENWAYLLANGKIKVLATIVIALVFILTLKSLHYMVSEFLFFGFLIMVFDLLRNVKYKNIDFDFLFISWFMAFFIFHSLYVIKDFRYFISMAPPVAYFLIRIYSISTSQFHFQIRNKNIIHISFSLILIILTVFSAFAYLPTISATNAHLKVMNENSASISSWLEDYDSEYKTKVIYSDYWPYTAWNLQMDVGKMPIYRDNQTLYTGSKDYNFTKQDMENYNNELDNNKVDYYFSRVGNLNLTNYRPIKQVGDFILYERVK